MPRVEPRMPMRGPLPVLSLLWCLARCCFSPGAWAIPPRSVACAAKCSCVRASPIGSTLDATAASRAGFGSLAGLFGWLRLLRIWSSSTLWLSTSVRRDVSSLTTSATEPRPTARFCAALIAAAMAGGAPSSSGPNSAMGREGAAPKRWLSACKKSSSRATAGPLRCARGSSYRPARSTTARSQPSSATRRPATVPSSLLPNHNFGGKVNRAGSAPLLCSS